MDNQNQADEKLLPNPADEKSLPVGFGAPTNLPTGGAPMGTAPRVSPVEFIKTTPPNELKNVFGMSPSENLRPIVPPPVAPRPVPPPTPVMPPRTSQTPFDLIQKKEVRKFEMPAAAPAPAAFQEPARQRNWAKIIAIIIAVIVILFVALYFWGAALNG